MQAGKGSADDASGWLTRAQVARRLRVSASSVRRLEGDQLHPVVDVKGWHRFDPQEIEAHLRSRALAVVRSARRRSRRDDLKEADDAGDEGLHHALLFRLFEAGKSHSAVVIETNLPSEVVRQAYREWRSGYRAPETMVCVEDPTLEREREASEWRSWEEAIRALNVDLQPDRRISRRLSPGSVARWRRG